MIFIMPPSMPILRARLLELGTDSAADSQRRLATAIQELKAILTYDYLVINDDLDTAVEDVLSIIRAEECRSSRYFEPSQSFLKEKL